MSKMNIMKIRSILVLASTLIIACGSELSANTAPDLVPPGFDHPGPSNPNKDNDNKADSNVIDEADSGGGGNWSGDESDADALHANDGGNADLSDGSTTESSDVATTDPIDPSEPTDPSTDSGTVEQDAGTVEPSSPPTTATVGGVKIDFVSQSGNTFCYQVTELDDAKDLSHWDLATNCVVLSGAPKAGFEIGTDPKGGIKGVKWNASGGFETGLFCLTVDGSPTLDTTDVASKSGWPFSYGKIVGPVCK